MRTQKLVGGNPSNVSWGRSSLYSCIHSALNLAQLSQRLEHLGVEHLMVERSIESFHKGILIRLARLNIPQSNPSVRTPPRNAVGEKFLAIVEPNRLRLAPPSGDVLQAPAP